MGILVIIKGAVAMYPSEECFVPRTNPRTRKANYSVGLMFRVAV